MAIKPIPGTRWAVKARASREPTSALCASCDRPRATVECADCGEMLHKGCYARHMDVHAQEIADLYGFTEGEDN